MYMYMHNPCLCFLIKKNIMLNFFPRHPSPSDRPSFTALCQYLSQPSESLLQLGISQAELEESPQADMLGGPLDAGQTLFKDIQIRYLE